MVQLKSGGWGMHEALVAGIQHQEKGESETKNDEKMIKNQQTRHIYNMRQLRSVNPGKKENKWVEKVGQRNWNG